MRVRECTYRQMERLTECLNSFQLCMKGLKTAKFEHKQNKDIHTKPPKKNSSHFKSMYLKLIKRNKINFKNS